MYLSAEEIAAIKDRVDREPWARGFDRLMDSAGVAMDREPDPVEGDYTAGGADAPTAVPIRTAHARLVRDWIRQVAIFFLTYRRRLRT
jgi:hypothetical protein